MAEPVPATGYGPATWINWTHNWRKEDGDFLQYRGILRYADDGSRPASPQIGQAVFSQASDIVSFWASTSEWVPLLSSRLLRLVTAGVSPSGTATFAHKDASGAGLVFSNTKIRSSIDFETSAGLTADTVSIKTAAGGGNRTAKLTSSATSLVSDSPILAPTMILNGAAGADALTLSAGNLKVGGSAAIGTSLAVGTGITAATVLLNGTVQDTATNAVTRKKYVDDQILAGDNGRVATTGDTMTGALTATAVYLSSGQPSAANSLTRKDYVDTAVGKCLATTGDTMTGTIVSQPSNGLGMRIRADAGPYIDFYNAAGTVRYGYLQAQPSTGSMYLYSDSSDIGIRSGGQINFYTSGTFLGAMIGNGFLWGKAAADVHNAGVEMYGGGGSEGMVLSTTAAVTNFYAHHIGTNDAANKAFMQFLAGSTTVLLSEIRQNSTRNGVLFVNCVASAPSDYRWKDDLGPITGALDRVMELRPKRLRWKASGEEFEGFIAHEAGEILPYLVTGSKDAVTRDGKIEGQGFNYGGETPLLTAALQELTERVITLESAA